MAEKISAMTPAAQSFAGDLTEVTQGAPGTPVTRSVSETQRFDLMKTFFAADLPLVYTSATATYSLNINATNLRLDGTDLNTIQDIDTTATPQFSQMSLNSAQNAVNGVAVGLLIKEDAGIPIEIGLTSYGAARLTGVHHFHANGTEGAPTAAIDNDYIHIDRYYGYDGATFSLGSEFLTRVDGVVSAGKVPTKFQWATRNDAGSLGNRMTLTANGILAVGTEAPETTALFHLASTTQGGLIAPMTQGQRDAIVTPAEGLEIWNLTSHKKNFFDGTDWVESDDLPVFTNDAVPFGTPGGTLTEDPDNFTFNSTNQTLSVGAQSTDLTVNGSARRGSFLSVSNGVAERWGIIGVSFSSTTASALNLARARGSEASPTAVNSGDELGALSAIGYNGTDYSYGSTIKTVAAANFVDGDTPSYLCFETTKDGAEVTTEGMRLTEAQQLVVSDTGAVTPEASAVLQADSTTRGLLPPRMTTTQRNAIVSPASGLIIFNITTSQFDGYNGTSWVILG